MRWVLGTQGTPGDKLIALDLFETQKAANWIGFDEVMNGRVDPTEHIYIEPPQWRGYRFLSLLEYLVCGALGTRDSEVVWKAPRKGGATGVRRLLTERGWRFAESKGSVRTFTGNPPPPGHPVEPRMFETELGGHLSFYADWGAFSEEHIDPGTRMLFDFIAERGRRIQSVLDVGCGYGPLCIALVASGIAAQAQATEVDFVSAWLARRNAAGAGVELNLMTNADPGSAGPTEVTICALPTHAPSANAELLITSLYQRASQSEVLVVLHASLAARYARRFESAGAMVKVHSAATHAILELSQ